MAKYDQGGGCPCGLQKVCDCKSELANAAEKEKEYERMKPVNGVFYKMTDSPQVFQMQASSTLTGLSSKYYELPEGCKELQDLIEYKNMNFARGNVFKAAYRLGDKPGTDQIYDWEKIIWFAQREIERLKNAEKSSD